MFNRKVVQKALKKTWTLEGNPGCNPDKPTNCQSSIISRLIYDIFGGEILKTHKKKGWYFYNRIDGKRIDFTGTDLVKSSVDNRLKELPSAPDETFDYFAQEDYSTLFIRFIRLFEEEVGLEKCRSRYIA
jgi:hypothetical protein